MPVIFKSTTKVTFYYLTPGVHGVYPSPYLIPICIHQSWNRVTGHRVTGSAITSGSGRVMGHLLWPGSSSGIHWQCRPPTRTLLQNERSQWRSLRRSQRLLQWSESQTNDHDHELVLIDIESEVDLGHVCRHRQTSTSQSRQEHLRLRHVAVAICLRLRLQISTQTRRVCNKLINKKVSK